MSGTSRTEPARSSTPARLRLLRTLILAVTVLVGLAVTGTVLGAQTTVAAAAERTAPAATAVRVAQASLAEANRAVTDSFRSGTAHLAGPGQRYQDGITRANHSLAQLAEYYAGEVAATQRLRFVNAMLVTYLGLVGQADTAHRIAAATGAGYDLGLIYLWQASKLLLDPADGILAGLDSLAEPVDRDLVDQAGAWPLRPAGLAGSLLLAVVLGGLLGVAQLFLFRRFQRILNPALALATILLIFLTAWSGLTILDTRGELRSALAAHAELTAAWQRQAADARTATHADLAILLSGPCGGEPSCRSAVDAALAAVAPAAPDDATSPADLSQTGPAPQTQAEFQAAMTAAAVPAGLPAGVPIQALAIAGLVALGFAPRLAEYRS